MDSVPSSFMTKQSSNPGNTPSVREPTPSAPEPMMVRLWNWWSMLTGPRKEAFGVDLRAQEQLRRARLISILLLIIVIVVVLLIPAVYPSSPSIWTPIIILSVGGVLIAVCNRTGHTTLSGISYVLLVDIALAGFFYLKPMPALNSTNMTALDLFLLTVLVGGIVLPKALIPCTGILQGLLICAIFFLRPHDASMVALIQIAGNAYVALMPTLVLLLVGTTLAWVHAWSVERALKRANQAEELAEARAELSRRAVMMAEQNRRLEEGIASILETHRQIAGGNLAARAPVQEDHELWQIGHSLNFLLMRIQQQAQDYRQLQLTQQEVEQVIRTVEVARAGGRATLPPCRTSLAQRLLMLLRR